MGGGGGGSSCSTCCWGCAGEEPDPELFAFEVRRENSLTRLFVVDKPRWCFAEGGEASRGTDRIKDSDAKSEISTLPERVCPGFGEVGFVGVAYPKF